MWASLLQTVLYNPLSLSDTWRAHEVSTRLSFADLILLPGTQQRRRAGDPPTRMKLEKHTMVQFGWQRGKYTNKSAGCAIMLRRRAFREAHVHE
eukprot:8070662-Pyramimonas_sp.AAC.1